MQFSQEFLPGLYQFSQGASGQRIFVRLFQCVNTFSEFINSCLPEFIPFGGQRD